MAEKKSGPVKPPTLDMQARRTSPRTPQKPVEAETPASVDASEKTTGPKNDSGTKPDQTSESAAPKSDAKPESTTASKSAQGDTGPRSAKTTSARPTPTGATSTRDTSQKRASKHADTHWLYPAAIGAGGGALIGIIVVLGLAASGLLSGLMPDNSDNALSDRVTLAEEQVSESLVGFNALDQRVSDLQDQVQTGQTSDTDLDAITARQDELAASLDALQSAPQNDVDLTPLQNRIDQLSARVDALAAGASGDEATQLAEDLTSIQSDLSALNTQNESLASSVADLQSNMDETSAGNARNAEAIAALQTDITALQAEPETSPQDNRLLRLPFALSGLQTALDNGQPFAADLQSLQTMVPGLQLSEQLIAKAETGLPAPAQIIVQFNRAMPDIMAARPVDPDANWRDAIWARIKSALAIRPTRGSGGDGIENLLASAETALDNRDFAAADTALGQLPAPMQQPAGPVLSDISSMAEASGIIPQARSLALSDSVENAENIENTENAE